MKVYWNKAYCSRYYYSEWGAFLKTVERPAKHED
jgi:hypothetical protein